MKIKTFEQFLEEQCFKQNPRVFDDDMPDFFSDWVSALNPDDFIDFGDMYAKDLLTDILPSEALREIEDKPI